MADNDFCLLCGKSIGMWDKTCIHCGYNQFGNNNEFYPDEKAMRAVRTMPKTGKEGVLSRLLRRKQKQPIFTKEESFLYGIHPNDKMYRKTMELDILSKNYRE